MRIVDLSRELYHRTPAYPGQPPIIYGIWKTHEESQCESLISLASTSTGSSLGSAWEAGGAIWSGVLPSMCLRPSGKTITRWNVTTLGPPLRSEASKVLGRPREDTF
jgi:hypothetical protein